MDESSHPASQSHHPTSSLFCMHPTTGKGKGVIYNVYAQPIDPTNQMPANPNQAPAPGQEVPLSTSRVTSTIPKGGTYTETWTYPSPQVNEAQHRARAIEGTGDGIDPCVC